MSNVVLKQTPQPLATVLAQGQIVPLQNFPCAVCELPDGTISRVLSVRKFRTSLGMNPTTTTTHESVGQTGGFEPPKNLIPFISSDIKVSGTTIPYPVRGGIAHGVRAELLPEVCSAYVAASLAGALRPSQHHVFQHCLKVLTVLAKTGIVALVDEASGYQTSRANDDLQRLVVLYLRDTPLEWRKTLPDAYYAELYRVLGLKYQPRRGRHPQYIGVYTRRYLYNPIVPAALWPELDRRNPFITAYHRKTKLHCWLSSELGQSRLTSQLTLVTGLLRASAVWPQFVRLYASAQPHGSQLSMYPVEVVHA